MVLLKESLFASIVFACVWLLTCSKQMRSPRLRYGLWCLVFIRLLLPPSFSLPWSMSSLFSAWQPALRPAQPTVTILDPLGYEAPMSMPAQLANAQNHWVWWALTGAWLLGVAIFLLRFYKGRKFFHRLVGNAQLVTDPIVMTACRRWCQLLGIRRPVQVVHAARTISPFTLGWRKPIVFLPSEILEGAPASWEPALAHELAHVKRGDDIWIQLGAMLKAVYFFHPLVWLALRQSHHERERLCDRMVIRSGGMAAGTYGRGLLHIFAKQLHVVRGIPALSPTAELVATRLTSLSHYANTKPAPLLSTLFLMALGLLMLPMATAKSRQPQQGPSEIQWRHPLPAARTSSEYGLRNHPFSRKKMFHKGTDFAAPEGTWILAPAAGVVVQATERYEKGESYGTVIVLQHNNRFTSFYSHLNSLAVRPGQKVKQGQRIGTVGMTGMTTAPHLHFEIWEHGEHTNPRDFLQGKEHLPKK